MKHAGGGPAIPSSNQVLRGRQPSVESPGGSAPESSTPPSQWSFREAESAEEDDMSPFES